MSYDVGHVTDFSGMVQAPDKREQCGISVALVEVFWGVERLQG